MQVENDERRPHRRSYSRPEAAHDLGISIRALDERIRRGEVRVYRFGRRVLITSEEIERIRAFGSSGIWSTRPLLSGESK